MIVFTKNSIIFTPLREISFCSVRIVVQTKLLLLLFSRKILLDNYGDFPNLVSRKNVALDKRRFSLISRDIVFQQLKNLTNFGSVALFTFGMADLHLERIPRL